MVYILLSSLLSFNIFAADLPKLLTKQDTSSIRYISSDGQSVYYQTKLGVLNLTKNYSNKILMDLKDYTQYFFSDSLKGNILFEVNQNFHDNLSHRSQSAIYITKIGDSKIKKIGNGINSKLELNGNWISYYMPTDQSVNFKNILNPSNTMHIKLKNSINPFFQPIHHMISKNDVLYTDINKDGHMGLVTYSKMDKKYQTIFKTKNKGAAVDFCHIGDNLYVMEKGLFSLTGGSQLFKIPLYKNPRYVKKEILYTSKFNDIGQLLCKKDFLYFIKTISYDKKLNTKYSEIFKLTYKSKKLEQISSLKNVTNLFEMGDRVLTEYKSNFYIVEGKNNAKNDAISTD